MFTNMQPSVPKPAPARSTWILLPPISGRWRRSSAWSTEMAGLPVGACACVPVAGSTDTSVGIPSNSAGIRAAVASSSGGSLVAT